MQRADSTVLARQLMPLPVTVRLCQPSDLALLEWFGSFAHHREILAEAFARQSRGENLMLVADLGGFPIGQAWIDLVKRGQEGVGVLWAIRVLAPLQNAGLGSLLVRCAEQLLRERGFLTAELGVEKDNPAARRLYERLGYALADELTESYSYTTPEGQPVRHVVEQWILRKALAPPPHPDDLGSGEVPPRQQSRSYG